MGETWTILKVLQWTTSYFSRKGISQPRAGAEVLLAHVLGMERIDLYLHYDQPLNPSELARYRECVRRRAAFEPTQYITGKQEFWSLDFEVTPSVLIPRPETELLVEKTLESVEDPAQVILDLCTGSGAVAVALAHERPSLKLVASDISPEALKVAKRNALRHHVEQRIAFIASDLFNAFSFNALFDIIVTNPPYISEAELDALAPEVVRYEPRTALEGRGALGLDIIRKILDKAPSYLKPGGILLVEIGQGQAEIVREELKGNRRFKPPELIRDYSGILRVLRLRKSRVSDGVGQAEG